MELSEQTLHKALVAPGHIPEKDFNALAEESRNGGAPLYDLLVERGFVSNKNLGQAIANVFDRPFADIEEMQISEQLLSYVPEAVAQAQKIIVFGEDDDTLKVATPLLENYELFKFLEKKTGKNVEVYYATPASIEEVLKRYKADAALRIRDLVKKLGSGAGGEGDVVALMDLFLEYAFDNHASDIHIEPLERNVSVRFRIDGVLHEVATYPKALHDKVVFRIKILARLRTDEHGAAQDGRFTHTTASSEGGREKKFNVRTSVLPVMDGENVVMRILVENTKELTIDTLGLSSADLEKIKRAASKPYGMILAVGPTGSGKTTTLYGVLRTLNRPEVNIITIEDPTEYNISHVQQTQVNAQKNLTFATGLRSIVRQDPDIIMVGEIRDNETADIAVNAAMTGHLLLSTLHTNDAATTFPRLADLGVEAFLVASSVNVIVAQRLVRMVCNSCKQSYFLSAEEISVLGTEPHIAEYARSISGNDDLSTIRFYRGAGCKVCGGTGYSGRTGVFEVLEVTDEIRPLVIEKRSADEIGKKAHSLGMTTMLEDAVAKALQGVTTPEEVMRAVRS